LIPAPKVEKNNEMEIPSQASSSSSSSSSSKLQQSPPPLTKFVVMENTGHCPHEEDPETLASVVRDFLREASVM
jgi:pimeloyl-ACP methyl ester carboxylesterase